MTYYEVLEIDSRAKTDEIERAYRRLARKVHPDLAAGDRAKAEARMKLLNEIRDVLTDPLLRAGYDERLRLEAERSPPRRPQPAHEAEPSAYDAPPEPPRAGPRPRAVVLDPTPERPRRPWLATLLLSGLGVGGVVAAYTFYPALARHLPDFSETASARSAPDAGPLLAAPTLGRAGAGGHTATRLRVRTRGAVHLGSTADDVLRALGPPDAVERGRHPGESVMRYGSLHLDMNNGRVVGGDAAVR